MQLPAAFVIKNDIFCFLNVFFLLLFHSEEKVFTSFFHGYHQTRSFTDPPERRQKSFLKKRFLLVLSQQNGFQNDMFVAFKHRCMHRWKRDQKLTAAAEDLLLNYTTFTTLLLFLVNHHTARGLWTGHSLIGDLWSGLFCGIAICGAFLW